MSKKHLNFYILLFIVSAATSSYALGKKNNPNQNDIEIRKMIEESTKKLENEFGFKLKKRIKYEIKSRQEVEKYLLKILNRDYSDEQISLISTLYRKLGLMQAMVDPKKIMVDLYREEAAGFYDPKVKKLFLINDVHPVLQKPIIYHEIVHIFQDEKINLYDKMSNLKNNDDGLLAFQALIEGEATYLMFKDLNIPGELIYNLIEKSQNERGLTSKTLANSPLFFKKMLIFPYLEGVKYVTACRKNKSMPTRYENIPARTRDILHCNEKEKDIKEMDELKIQVFKGLKSRLSTSLGEFTLRILFEIFIPTNENNEKAIMGLENDRINLLYDKKNVESLYWVTIWDTQNDAREFHDEYTKLLKIKYGAIVDWCINIKDKKTTIGEGKVCSSF